MPTQVRSADLFLIKSRFSSHRARERVAGQVKRVLLKGKTDNKK